MKEQQYPYINVIQLIPCKGNESLDILSFSNITDSSLTNHNWQLFMKNRQHAITGAKRNKKQNKSANQ